MPSVLLLLGAMAAGAMGLAVLMLLWQYTYWTRRGVPQTGTLPVPGDLLQVVLMRRTMGNITMDIYRRFNKYPYVGIYKIYQPVLLLRDPELVREVLVQKFSNFSSNEVDSTGGDPVLEENPFFITMEKWKEARSWVAQSLSPARVRQSFDGAADSARLLGDLLQAEGASTSQDGITLSKRYTAHVAVRSMFGIDGDSLQIGSSPGIFYEMGNKVLGEGFSSRMKMMVFLFCPRAMPWLGLKVFSKEIVAFFRKLVGDSVEYRRKEGISRNDFVDYASKRCLDENGRIDDVALDKVGAQCVNAFTESFETSALTMTSTLLLLAVNPDEQDKLRRELRAAFPGGKLDYEVLSNHGYLDQVLKEAMRLFPAADTLRRKCVKACTLEPKTIPGKPVHLYPGALVYVSVDAVHRDPTLYEQPDAFRPDHFSEEECSRRPKCTFLSFGEGPRMCVGMRYALMQVKVAVASLVMRFDLQPGPEQVLPIRRDPASPLLGFVGGIHLRFTPL